MNCEYCQMIHDGSYASGRFCSIKCARGFSTSKNRDQITLRTKTTLRKKNPRYCKWCGSQFVPGVSRDYCSQACLTSERIDRGIKTGIIAQKGKFKTPCSIFDVSARTFSKIIERLGVGCSRCGWNEAKCDIHHIKGKKIENANHHSNLTYLCPNCHRLVHSNKVDVNSLITFENQIGNRWLDVYYG